MEIAQVIAIIVIVLEVVLLNFEFKRDVMMFQQNSYRPERYMRWLRQSGDSTSATRLIAIFIVLFCLAGFGLQFVALICAGVYALWMSVVLARRKYKKPLVLTKRACRLMAVNYLLTALIVILAIFGSVYGLFGKVLPWYTACVTLLVIYCLSHYIIICSNFVLKPVESKINRKFYVNAQNKLNSLKDLKIIGITGSYGKTSTKHYLCRILSEQMETLMTPGSYNTTLGVVRTINEYLKPYHQAFIVEMGAKQNGDIKEICDLVHPSMGIITSVGPQHLETFGTIENVRDTKFELVDALPSDGYAILNNDYPIIADRKVENCTAIRYSCSEENPGADYVATDIKYNSDGTSFRIKCPDGKYLDFETKLLGEYNIANLTAAIIVALTLGLDVDKIKYSVGRIESVEHRLSLKRMGNGVTLLDDAFNSNPAGASMAVNVLSNMTTGRRIIITPGMIELGEKQYELNFELGRHIAQKGIDYAAVVGNYNKEALTAGMKEGNMDAEHILHFDTFLDANAWMVAFTAPGDVVLIENDLPDTFK